MALPTYTWEEVAKHNTLASAWVAVEGRVYDVTAWAPRHPGGREYMRMAAGRDITALFHSYHPFTHAHEAVLPKYLIGTLASHELNTFQPDTGFYRDLREKVGAYFRERGVHPKDPVPGLVRLAALLLVMALTYAAIYAFPLPAALWPARLACAVVFGVCQALILLQMMHDASHSSIGYSERWWAVIGRLTMDWIAGASLTSWHHQHILGHHIYTNIMGTDPDLPANVAGDMRYLVPRQAWQLIYAYQHIYMPLLYGLLAIKFRIQDYTDTFSKATNGAIRVNPLSWVDWAGMLGAKLVHVVYRIVIPYLIFGLSWSDVLLYYLAIEMTTGWYLAFNFQVSHISTEAFFPLSTAFETSVPHEWAVVQVTTGVDYGHGNAAMAFLSGHLNYQIEHHLFPTVSQYHYPAIAPIVRGVCEQWRVPYNYVPSFYDAIATHLRYLYRMGTQRKLA